MKTENLEMDVDESMEHILSPKWSSSKKGREEGMKSIKKVDEIFSSTPDIDKDSNPFKSW